MKIMLLAMLFMVAGQLLADESQSRVENSQLRNPPRCEVYAGPGFTTSGGRCWGRDEVMVGITQTDPLMIRCARLQVRCYNRNGDKAPAVSLNP